MNNNTDIAANSVSNRISNQTLNVADAFTLTTNILDTKTDKSTTYTAETANRHVDAKVHDVGMVNYATKSDTGTKS